MGFYPSVLTVGRPKKTEAEVAFGRALGEALKAARLDKKFTSEELARSSRVGVDQVRSLERGRAASPGIYSVARLALALGVSIESITPEPGVDD